MYRPKKINQTAMEIIITVAVGAEKSLVYKIKLKYTNLINIKQEKMTENGLTKKHSKVKCK